MTSIPFVRHWLAPSQQYLPEQVDCFVALSCLKIQQLFQTVNINLGPSQCLELNQRIDLGYFREQKQNLQILFYQKILELLFFSGVCFRSPPNPILGSWGTITLYWPQWHSGHWKMAQKLCTIWVLCLTYGKGSWSETISSPDNYNTLVMYRI